MSIRNTGNRRSMQEFTGQFIPVGGFFYLGDLSDKTEVYEVVESQRCDGCCLCAKGIAPSCAGTDREDGKTVVFKKV